MLLADLAGRPGALVCLGRGHADVDDDDIGPLRVHGVMQRVGVAHLRRDLDAGLREAWRALPAGAPSPPRSRRARNFPTTGSSPAGWTLDDQTSAERLHPVGKPAQARAVLCVRPADAVILDLHDQHAVAPVRAHRRLRRVRVLDDVCQRLAGDKVAVASTCAGSRPSETSRATGIGALLVRDSSAAASPSSVRIAGCTRGQARAAPRPLLGARQQPRRGAGRSRGPSCRRARAGRCGAARQRPRAAAARRRVGRARSAGAPRRPPGRSGRATPAPRGAARACRRAVARFRRRAGPRRPRRGAAPARRLATRHGRSRRSARPRGRGGSPHGRRRLPVARAHDPGRPRTPVAPVARTPPRAGSPSARASASRMPSGGSAPARAPARRRSPASRAQHPGDERDRQRDEPRDLPPEEHVVDDCGGTVDDSEDPFVDGT